jgi:hypothetical protein
MFIAVPAVPAVGQRVHGDIQCASGGHALSQDDIRTNHHQLTVFGHAAAQRLEQRNNFIYE